MLSPLSKVPSTNGQAPATPSVTGRHIAKPTVNDTPQQRAADAARWLRGELAIKPNVALADRLVQIKGEGWKVIPLELGVLDED